MSRKIMIDRPLPDGTAIGRHRDFDGVLQKHRDFTRRPGYRALGLITGLLIIGMVAWLVFDADRIDRMGIDQPFTHLSVDTQAFVIDAQAGGVLPLYSGGKVTLPPSALVGAAGQKIEGRVLILVREMLNPVDIFLSGIPMTIDSAGRTYTFESGGMIWLEARSGSERLTLREGDQIVIEWPVRTPASFGVYMFDTVLNQWVRSGKNTVDSLNIQPTEPPGGSFFLSEDGEILDSLTIGSPRGDYASDTLSASLALDKSVVPGKTPAQRREELAKMERARRAAQRALMKGYAERNARLADIQDSIRERSAQLNREMGFVSRFAIHDFGFWNCDNPIVKEAPDLVEIRFTVDGQPFTRQSTVYLVDGSVNALFKYYLGMDQVHCELHHQNMLWMVHGKDQMAVVRPSDFSGLAAGRSAPLLLLPAEQALDSLYRWAGVKP